jgi:predicted DNA-binding transcriptional regulator AlpA
VTARIQSPKTQADLFSVIQIFKKLQASRSTFDEWRAKRFIPNVIRLTADQPRIKLQDIKVWLEAREIVDCDPSCIGT